MILATRKSKCAFTISYNLLISTLFVPYVSIWIDTGVGIPEEALPHIFERFYKGKEANKVSVGIGLSLSKTIIEHDKGVVSVESQKDHGTTFTIKYFSKHLSLKHLSKHWQILTWMIL